MLKIVFDPIGGFTLPDGQVLKYVEEEILSMMLDELFTYTICIGQTLILDAIRVKIKCVPIDVSKVELFVKKDNNEILVPIYQNGKLSSWEHFPEIYSEILSQLCK